MTTNSSNSSTVAPGGDGNTSTPPVASKPSAQGSCKKIWMVTMRSSNSSRASLAAWLKEHCSNAIWQLERGDKTGYEHYQITMKLKVKQRLTWIKNHLDKTAHIEEVRNIDASFDYTNKADTRIAGPWYWPEQVKSVRDPLEGKTYYDWQQEIIDMIADEPQDRKIYWYWDDEGNRGKSSFCKHLVLKHDAQFCNGKASDIYYALREDCRILIVDIPRSKKDYAHPYTVLEEVKNGMVFAGKYESRTKVFDAPHVIVFANFPPESTEMSADRWVIRNIDRKPDEANDDKLNERNNRIEQYLDQ